MARRFFLRPDSQASGGVSSGNSADSSADAVDNAALQGRYAGLPVLLWRQWCLLAVLAGMLFSGCADVSGSGTTLLAADANSPLIVDGFGLLSAGVLQALPALVSAVLLAVAMVLWSAPGSDSLSSRPRATVRFIVLGLCMVCGASVIAVGRSDPAAVPDWMSARQKVIVQGIVHAVESRPQGRLRVLLTDVRCLPVVPVKNKDKADSAQPQTSAKLGTADRASLSSNSSHPALARSGHSQPPLSLPDNEAETLRSGWQLLPKMTVWTWEYPLFRPQVGDVVQLEGRVKPVRGFLNEGSWNSGDFWRRQGVEFRVWTRAEKGRVQLIGPLVAGSAKHNVSEGLPEQTASVGYVSVVSAVAGEGNTGESPAVAGSGKAATAKGGVAIASDAAGDARLQMAATSVDIISTSAWRELLRNMQERAAQARSDVLRRLESTLIMMEAATKNKGETSTSGGAALDQGSSEKSEQAGPVKVVKSGDELLMPRWYAMSQATAVIPALLMGERFYLSSASMERLADSGLVHSFALSGMHLGFAAGFGVLVAVMLGWLFPRLYLVIPRQKLAVLCAAPMVGLYVWLGGGSPSLLRAALMFVFWAGLLLIGRRGILIDGLLWAVAVIVFLQPDAVLDLRLQLSALAVAGIACALPLFIRIHGVKGFAGFASGQGTMGGFGWRSVGWRVLRGATGILMISMAAQLALMPLTLNAFGAVTPWFILNVLWLPVLGMWVLPLAFAGLAALYIPFVSGVAPWLFTAAVMPAQWLFKLLEGLDGAGLLYPVLSVRPLPVTWAGFWLLLFAAFFLLWVRSKKTAVEGAKHKYTEGITLRLSAVRMLHWMVPVGVLLLMLGPCLRFAGYLKDTVSVSVMDVGQGQAVLVQAPYGVRVLVDAGGFTSGSFDIGRALVAPVLTYNQPPRLTAAMYSHPDSDHMGGLPFILKRFDVGAVYTNGQTPEGRDAKDWQAALDESGIAPVALQAGSRIALTSGAVLQVLGSGSGTIAGNTNDSSVVLRFAHQGRGLALLPADLGTLALDTLTSRLQAKGNESMQAQLVLVPHHGSGNSLSVPFYEAVAPQLAVASCGYLNYWGFPRHDVVTALKERSIPLLSTAAHGQITVFWGADGAMQVHTVD